MIAIVICKYESDEKWPEKILSVFVTCKLEEAQIKNG